MLDSTTCEPEKLDEPDPYLVLGHLSSTVVHHVINYFSSIVSQAEILKTLAVAAGVEQAEAVTRTDAIIKAALDGSTLARGLAEFSRRATAFTVVPGEADDDLVDLNQLVSERIADQKRRCGSNTEWIVNLAAAAKLRGEASHLRIMLDRLLENARESLPAEGGVVTVSTLVDPMEWLVLEIRDTGSGMEAEVLEHALEPFFSTKTGHQGLGLVLARGIWRRHRGAFSIETTPGHGTLVRLSCPPSGPRPPQNVQPRPVGAK
ncbi:sensor histidine kinase [Paludisphaera borealis]|uniref:histidine kinase n=1 Tax=Paludisphaera borealis TaxID=1387353 RepID=A0A1U7CYL6_9BACT|nr:HAMP domain-containing sensor histidine kinase [Paludisphaera borealis]APW63969.1 Sporulation kinase A [Paludisphaera borealis]